MNKLQELKQKRQSYIECFKWYSLEQIENENIMQKLQKLNQQIEQMEENIMQIMETNTITKDKINEKNKLSKWLDKLFQNSPSHSLMLINDNNVNGFLVIEKLQQICKLSQQESRNCVMEAHENGKAFVLSDDEKKLNNMKNKLSKFNITTEIE